MQPAISVTVQNNARNAEARPFFNWLCCWLLIPNLPFLPITLMGGPPRVTDILYGGITGLIVKRLNYGWRLAAFGALLAYMVLNFIARMFNMHISMLMSVIGLVVDIRPAVSVEYVTGAVLLVLTGLLGIWMLRQKNDFSSPRWLMSAVAAVLSLAAFDYAVSKDSMGSYSRFPDDGAAFTSASRQTDLIRLADGKTNIMVVVVEAMGQPNDPRMQARLDQIWLRPELSSRYEITTGHTTFYGSTTSGELRELCQRWGKYEDIRSHDPGCLPAMLALKGYRTTSYHAFSGSFFDRTRWYPLIGFQHMLFGRDLRKEGAGLCPSVFPGACDRDAPAIIARHLRQERGPQFIYWLTLNSHLPIIEDKALGTAGCHQNGAREDADFPMICRIFSIWEETAAALTNTVTGPDFPPTHILIVGDHMPPFTHQKSRLQFNSEQVPWILLRYRGAGEKGTPSAGNQPQG